MSSYYAFCKKYFKEENMASKTLGINQPIPAEASGNKLKQWFDRNYMYLASFFLPVVLVLIAYANFDIYPFGKEGSVLDSTLTVSISIILRQ